MSRSENSIRERPFVNPPPKKNEISRLVVERNPSEFEIRLSMGRWIYVIYPVTDGDGNIIKFNQDCIDK
tara:strand:- start:921 stop:1127 length:207 start_codon:yes stop_codon:yes gene_type:complete